MLTPAADVCILQHINSMVRIRFFAKGIIFIVCLIIVSLNTKAKLCFFFGIIKIMALFFDKIGVLMLVLLIYSMFFGVKGVNS